MIYTKKTQLAMKIAYKAHEGQYDKAGVPYVLHPFHVAEQMSTERECIVALLHDVVENTTVTIEDLAKDFDEEVIEALKLLTHNKKESYMSYIAKVKTNEIAKKVKMADIKHNSTASRLPKTTLRDIVRLTKYNKAMRYLQK